jgi:hypothetical protein
MNLYTKFQVSTTYRLDGNLLQTNKQKTSLINKICTSNDVMEIKKEESWRDK